MKTLTLIRHAKSTHSLPGLADIDRPLNERGEAAATLMGARLREANFDFDAVFCSRARRAQQTAAGIFCDDWAKRVEIAPRLYTFEETDLYRFIELLEPTLNSVVIVGHNPATTMLINDLCRSNIANVPTCGIAQIALEIENWFDVAPGTGKLINYDFPKRLIEEGRINNEG